MTTAHRTETFGTHRSRDPNETALAAELTSILVDATGMGTATASSDFFDDLGADSLLMARFCARVRKRSDLPSVSMRDVYTHRNAAALAAALTPPEGDPEGREEAPFRPEPPAAVAPAGNARTAAYVLCGVLQLTIFLGYTLAIATLAAPAYRWFAGAATLLELYVRAVIIGSGAFVALALLPIVAKWVLVGRWTPRSIPLWSVGYVRFWVVKTLIRANPLLLLAVGSPLLPLYLRALGATIGPRVVILTRSVPVCPDLLSIGADTVIRKDAVLSGYRARSGHLEIGGQRIGRDAFVGEAAVLDIHTVIGDGAQLGHASSLHGGQRIPDGAVWHGVPAQPSTASYRMSEPARCGHLRRVGYGVWQIAALLGIYLPAGLVGADALILAFPQLRSVAAELVAPLGLVGLAVEALLISGALLIGSLLAGLVLAAVVPRLLAPLVPPDRVLPLYGLRWSAYRLIARLTNLKFYLYLFGDSSYVIGYLRWIGYRMRRVAQTGTNFGTGVKHESPFLVTVGSGTMVADGLSVANAEFSSSGFMVSRATIGARSFLGNRVVYPAGSRVGENCLLATKVLVPVDGPVRTGVGLLGSPAFEIPRSVDRDARYDHVIDGVELHRQLRAKNRYNRRTIALALLVRWMHMFGLLVLSLIIAAEFDQWGAFALAGGLVANLLCTIAYFVLVERLALGFGRLRPRFCSVYDPYFWWHERFWKLVMPEGERMLAGTPFKNVVSRALGVRLGRRVFDDGCAMPERSLVTIGDDAVLNAGSVVQCHSQEDGTFKSDHTRIGDRVTLGVSAFVHYGVTIGDDAELTPDAFLMKGEEIPARHMWAGNPAREIGRV